MGRKHALTAAIITLNEEKTLARCLGSLTWVDEIVVVDANSQDRTREIATDPKSPWASRLKFITHEWQGFNVQRTLAMKSASNDWIFVLDSDEACSPDLRERLEKILAEDQPHPAWKVRRQEYFMGRPIHWGVGNPSYQDRFFNRAGVIYQNEIHEYPVFPVQPLRIEEPIEHWPDYHPDVFLRKMNHYSSIDALERIQKGQRTNLFRMLTTGPAMFLKNYFYYRAYRDGTHGLVLSLLEGVSRVVRHVKMWTIQQEMLKNKVV